MASEIGVVEEGEGSVWGGEFNWLKGVLNDVEERTAATLPRAGIGGINGINTTAEQAGLHRKYLEGFFSHRTVDWVYNKSHGAAIDLLEVFAMNYWGISPKTANELRANWAAFHEENKERPQAKYLQFCHSQGAIHVRNALAGASAEIRDRVIVVAIAPGAVVPAEICFRSYNYASKRDIVPYGELGYAGALNTHEFGSSRFFENVMERRKELTLLDPHPKAVDIDHDFQSPTFQEVIEQAVKRHAECNGEYS